MRIFFIITSYKFLFMGDLHATRTTGVAKTWLYQCSRVSNDLWLLFFPISCEMLFFGRVPRWLMKLNQFTFIEKNEQSTIFKEKFFFKLFFCLAYCSENVLYYCMCIVMYDLWPGPPILMYIIPYLCFFTCFSCHCILSVVFHIL